MGFGVGTVRSAVSMAVIFMVGRCYNGAALAERPGLPEVIMKVLLILAASAALALAGCNRSDNSAAKNSSAGATSGSSMETPKGAATGQASEGSTDATKAPQRPASK
jgi:hypothetical protein